MTRAEEGFYIFIYFLLSSSFEDMVPAANLTYYQHMTRQKSVPSHYPAGAAAT